MSGQGIYRNYGGDMTNTLPMVYTRALTNDATPAWDFRTQPQAVVINLGTNDISNNKGDPGHAVPRRRTAACSQTVRAQISGRVHHLHHRPAAQRDRPDDDPGPHRAVVQARNAAGDANIEYFDRISPQTSDKAACQYHPNPAENQIMGGLSSPPSCAPASAGRLRRR